MKRRVKLYFGEEAAAEPILYNLVRQFGMATNIMSAQMSAAGGEMEVEVEGDLEAVEAGLAFAVSRGVRVEVVEG